MSIRSRLAAVGIMSSQRGWRNGRTVPGPTRAPRVSSGGEGVPWGEWDDSVGPGEDLLRILPTVGPRPRVVLLSAPPELPVRLDPERVLVPVVACRRQEGPSEEPGVGQPPVREQLRRSEPEHEVLVACLHVSQPHLDTPPGTLEVAVWLRERVGAGVQGKTSGRGEWVPEKVGWTVGLESPGEGSPKGLTKTPGPDLSTTLRVFGRADSGVGPLRKPRRDPDLDLESRV